MTRVLRIGLIGAGMVSRHHLLASASLSDQARVVAIADPCAENAARRASEFGISQTFPDAEAILSATELDAIDIAAPQDNLETLRLVEDCYRLAGWEASR
ncbi:hypothetical protein CQ12_07775 [Bradyrhizobium jicamae]|uniref:Gfo/Idh/MocA-like oxidoreductase N-terminal domain-containing protein n=1 Tax=Bradyrhizobium jicamae TaxID=280332 RepID=A0A0R3MB14_9BRAD|nr:Gfo/Idh/MocA family oxidoreductase [Bradyrhizobium jicamae]KRR15157.1 hypothetical protein CQ12_07775 [Bradyrhizobium jicamae]